MTSLKTRLTSLLLMNFRLCLIEIGTNKTRSFISSFGIFLGVASLLILLSFARAMNKDVTRSIVRMGGVNNLTLRQLEPQNKQEELEFRRSPGLRLDQAERLTKEFPEIKQLLPELSGPRGEYYSGGKSAHGRSRAVVYSSFDAYDYQFSAGRKFTPEEEEKGSPVCVIGNDMATRLFGKDNPLQKSVVVNRLPLRIVGVVYTEARWDRRARELLYPLALHLKYFAGPDTRFSEIVVEAQESSDMADLRNKLTSRLISLHRGAQDFEVVLNEDKIEELKKTTRALDILLLILAGLSLFIGGISITNIMFATIGDRIREIGLRKALGAKRSDLFVQFLIEAVLLCFVGGLPGMLFGSIPVLLPEGILPMEPTLTTSDYLLGMGFTLFIGFAAGVFPALKAANMKPVEALQYA